MTITFKVDNLNSMSAKLKGYANELRDNGIDEDDVFMCRLVSCELLANVIRHGGEEAEFESSIRPDSIEITITADSQKGVVISTEMPDAMAEHGRGMGIVAKASMYGIQKGDGGQFRVCIRRTSATASQCSQSGQNGQNVQSGQSGQSSTGAAPQEEGSGHSQSGV